MWRGEPEAVVACDHVVFSTTILNHFHFIHSYTKCIEIEGEKYNDYNDVSVHIQSLNLYLICGRATQMSS